MRIIDEPLLQLFRDKQQCEYCGRKLRYRPEVHHVFARGMGSGTRLDIAINLIALGSWMDCSCHQRFHAGHIARHDLLAVVAAREKMLQDDIEREICRLRQARKP